MKIRIFLGTGGVGKTSVAAASGLRAALEGGRCLVLTIDPAARLKTALGMAMDGQARRVPLDAYEASPKNTPKGELWAAQLDMKTALDQMVRRLAKPAQVELVLNHRIYQALGEMAGMQELMAVERIGQALEPGFDSIMVDTAPSRHALEFLDKPEYLVDLVSAPMVKLIGRTYQLWERSPLARLSRMGMDLYGQVEKLVGVQLTRDVLDFFSAFQGVAEGYAKEAEKTIAVLRDPQTTSFTLVSTPFKARADAAWFPEELKKRKFAVERLVVNRIWPGLQVEAESGASEEARDLVAWYHGVSAAHARAVEAVRSEYAAKIPHLVTLMELSNDVDGIAALYRISQSLDS